MSNFFTEGHGGTPESILLLARQLHSTGIRCDVVCNRGLCINAGERECLPAADDESTFRPHTALSMSDYGAVFVAGSWNRRAPLLVLRAIMLRLPVFYAAKGCLSRIEFSRLRDMRRVPYLFLVELLLLLLAKKIIFTSRVEMMACVVPAFLWRRKAVLIPEPFEGGAVIAPQSHDTITLGFLAEISPRKGLLELIAGFGAFLRAAPRPAKLRIAGAPRPGAEGYMARCRALAEANGSAAHIEWLQPIRGARRYDFYASLDLFVCPSQFESFGLTPLEALWQGTPVCAGPQLGVLEFLVDDPPVLRLPSLKAHDVAEGLSTLVSLPAARNGARPWAGRPACSPSNAQIAEIFAKLFFPTPVHP